MIIGACGYGATGSSIITDLLREYSDVQVFDDFEFSFAYRVDGLQDLEYHVVKQYSKAISGDTAIRRFLKASDYIYTPLIHKPTDAATFKRITKKFIDSIVQTEFIGMESIDVNSGAVMKNIVNLGMKKVILPKFERKLGHQTYGWPNRKIFVCVKPQNFYDAARAYIRDILTEMGADFKKTIVIDQPFEGNAPEQSYKFFDDSIAIVIDRDPRDLFLEEKYALNGEARFTPRRDVRDFVEYFKRVRTDTAKNSDRVLVVRFEDMIYEYDKSVAQIEAFTNLHNHKLKKKYFNPKRSINNTQLIRRHPEEIDNIRYIEKKLADYLYPFENYPDAEISGDVFLGSAKYYENKK